MRKKEKSPQNWLFVYEVKKNTFCKVHKYTIQGEG